MAVSFVAYLVIFSVPLAREKFMLDASDPAMTTTAVLLGVAAAAAIEVAWWVEGRILGEPRRVWR